MLSTVAIGITWQYIRGEEVNAINKETVSIGNVRIQMPGGGHQNGYAGGVQIDLDECVECGVCLRWRVCPTDSIYQQELNGLERLGAYERCIDYCRGIADIRARN